MSLVSLPLLVLRAFVRLKRCGSILVAFIAFEKPYDPVEIVEAIIKDLQATGVSHTRYTNRLQPVVSTCHALTLLDIDALSHGLIEEKFTAFTKESGKAHVTVGCYHYQTRWNMDLIVMAHACSISSTRPCAIIAHFIPAKRSFSLLVELFKPSLRDLIRHSQHQPT